MFEGSDTFYDDRAGASPALPEDGDTALTNQIDKLPLEDSKDLVLDAMLLPINRSRQMSGDERDRVYVNIADAQQLLIEVSLEEPEAVRALSEIYEGIANADQKVSSLLIRGPNRINYYFESVNIAGKRHRWKDPETIRAQARKIAEGLVTYADFAQEGKRPLFEKVCPPKEVLVRQMDELFLKDQYWNRLLTTIGMGAAPFTKRYVANVKAAQGLIEECQKELFEGNRRIVLGGIKHVKAPLTPDTLQDGERGLRVAVESFHPSVGSFSTHAYNHIRRFVLKGMSSTCNVVSVPKDYLSANAALSGRNNPELVALAQQAKGSQTSFQTPVGDGDDPSIMMDLLSPYSITPEDTYLQKESAALMETFFTRLSDEEAKFWGAVLYGDCEDIANYKKRFPETKAYEAFKTKCETRAARVLREIGMIAPSRRPSRRGQEGRRAPAPL